MSAEEASDLAELIRRIIAEMKCGVLLIEHNIGLVLNICDHIHVLDSGEIIEVGPPRPSRPARRSATPIWARRPRRQGAVL